jgi:hypothetical protein
VQNIKTEADGMAQVLRRQLLRRQAMRPEAIAEETGLSVGAVRMGLQDLVAAGEVEPLSPVSVASGREQAAAPTHYRLLRETDTDYLWEQELLLREPSRRALEFCGLDFAEKEPVRHDGGWDSPGAYLDVGRYAAFEVV